MFKRKPRSYGQAARQLVYPRGGWGRAFRYLGHRIRRLPDQPHRIGRGVAAGVFASFTPLFGLHFIVAAALAWLIRGNLVAALIATAFGNPVTFPAIAAVSVTTGRWILGKDGYLSPGQIMEEIGAAGAQMWHNFTAIFSDEVAHWDRLSSFSSEIFWPYTIGGILPGLACAVVCHYLTVPVIRAYHGRRARRMAERIQKLREVNPAPVAPVVAPAVTLTIAPAAEPAPSAPASASAPDPLTPLVNPAQHIPGPTLPPESR